ncbi:MAG: hypothetical protein IPP38_10310 [Bacteroidetes bacterium]|nr:hypothetical protein [Bacteroidota bacterium]
MSSNPSFNPAGLYTDAAGNILYYENQTDNYQQDYYQLIHAIELSPSLLLNTAVHYTKGKGYYEEYSVGDAFSKYGLPDIYTATDTISSSRFHSQTMAQQRFPTDSPPIFIMRKKMEFHSRTLRE